MKYILYLLLICPYFPLVDKRVRLAAVLKFLAVFSVADVGESDLLFLPLTKLAFPVVVDTLSAVNELLLLGPKHFAASALALF